MVPFSPTAPLKPRRVVLLGGGGFLGRHVGHYFRGRDVTCVSLGRRDLDLAAGNADVLADNLKADDAVVMLSVASGRAVAEEAYDANLRMANAVVTAVKLRPVAHVTYVSSEAVYGTAGAGGAVDESATPLPPDTYGAMHLARERLFEALEGNVAILRPVMVLGADDPHNAYGPNRFVRDALAGGLVTLFGEGDDVRDYVSAEDFAAVVGAVVACAGHGTLNVASGEPLPARRAAEICFAALGLPVRMQSVPRSQPASARIYDTALRRKMLPHVFVKPAAAAIQELAAGARKLQ
ncbi:NAD-dependent epimerase/dehydratase family protein [Undibacter mobilis]|uniref:NAD(P)-dependent oxidoreductase n=1 Tax=Undibacter mobilis TaxID=2292256 RepID=A0A371B6E8_9BRAD|nr:NAD(P)-dependent oxidoreductase [Undibacter mobilis]RDV03150.1 NAD(P)-dependent oxidoreductase [Undibacter mobilis]